jgi:hypothetical protein
VPDRRASDLSVARPRTHAPARAQVRHGSRGGMGRDGKNTTRVHERGGVWTDGERRPPCCLFYLISLVRATRERRRGVDMAPAQIKPGWIRTEEVMWPVS